MSATFWNKRRREAALKKKSVPDKNVGNIEPEAEVKKSNKRGKSGK